MIRKKGKVLENKAKESRSETVATEKKIHLFSLFRDINKGTNRDSYSKKQRNRLEEKERRTKVSDLANRGR